MILIFICIITNLSPSSFYISVTDKESSVLSPKSCNHEGIHLRYIFYFATLCNKVTLCINLCSKNSGNLECSSSNNQTDISVYPSQWHALQQPKGCHHSYSNDRNAKLCAINLKSIRQCEYASAQGYQFQMNFISLCLSPTFYPLLTPLRIKFIKLKNTFALFFGPLDISLSHLICPCHCQCWLELSYTYVTVWLTMKKVNHSMDCSFCQSTNCLVNERRSARAERWCRI